MGSSGEEKFKVFMFPWLAHGHISPFLELAKNLSHRNFDVYICSTPVNLKSIKNKIITEKYSIFMHLVELHLPDSELPPHYHTTNGLPLHLQPALFKTLKMAKSNLSILLKNLQPDLLIHDILLEWVASVASLHKIPALQFTTSSAAMCSYFCHLERYPEIEFPFPAIRLTDYEQSMAFNMVESAQEVSEDDQVETDYGIILMNSSREIEGKYMDYLAELMNWEIVPLGAMVQDPNNIGDGNEVVDDDDTKLIEWLGGKDERSSVFVSFGTEYFLKREEIQEIAYGLEMSNVNLIWVIRSPKGEEIRVEELLPERFLERVQGRGMIVEKWAPQAKILKQSSIGGFVSHCGWNSLMESIDFGVPIIAMPMQLDQPLNAKLMVELGVGVEVVRDGVNWRLRREDIAKVIRDVVVGERGEILRRKVAEQRDSIRARSREEMEGVMLKLKELCGKRRQAM
ncbi:hypothetical protein DH2020_030115 [Rehmannia glutinosa]|uniref:Glycosyltransferase n=1 Tax=Rehmannia glutinosa TaxID=99300 RepID=A0ABR0VLP6_REHGL